MTEDHFSPSQRYSLSISQVETKPGYFSHTKGVVRNHALDIVAEVDRNYGSFPFLFIEDHPNGHDYLVCGTDYQGQTVIELDTGKRKDLLSRGAGEGYGFCWAEYRFNDETQ